MNRPLIVCALMALVCSDLTAQRGGRFRRPDKAAFEKPPLVRWQRNLADALELSRATGKPLLLAVNMDGEIACDQFAGLRYRDAEFAELAQGFVALIASPDRHTPTDHDAQGRRIPCPRFGTVVCSEHIDIEPELYRRYFKGQRSAPRHVGIDADGNELFDLFLLNRLANVDDALKAHGKPSQASSQIAEAKSLVDLYGSRDAADRSRLEREFEGASALVQTDMLSKLEEQPVRRFDILRMGLYVDSPRVRRAAIDSLARTATPVALSLFDHACDVAETLGGLKPLLLALQRIAADNIDADRLARTRVGLYGKSKIVDLKAWLGAMGKNKEPVSNQNRSVDTEALDRLLTELGREAQRSPNNGEVQLAIASANLEYGQAQLAAGRDPSFLFQDALQAAKLAESKGAAMGPAKGYQAWVHYLLGDFEAATAAASAALPLLQSSARSKLSAEVLRVFATCRTRALYEAFTRDSKWPAEWVSDIHSAQQVLAQHRHAKQDQAASHIDLLVFLKAFNQEGQALAVSINRFPESPDIQECMRRRLLRDRGPQGLIDGYREITPPKGKQANHAWFAGYANLVAAEQFIEKDNGELAIPAYTDAIALFQESVDRSPVYTDSANHFIALALAGRGRLEMTAKALTAAVGDVCASLERRPHSARSTDGLGNTPLGTARLLRSALASAEDPSLSKKLSAKLGELGFDLGEEDSR